MLLQAYLSIASCGDGNTRHPSFCRARRAAVGIKLKVGNSDRGRSRGGCRLKLAMIAQSIFRNSQAYATWRVALSLRLRDFQSPCPSPKSVEVYYSLWKRDGR